MIWKAVLGPHASSFLNTLNASLKMAAVVIPERNPIMTPYVEWQLEIQALAFQESGRV
jgi:hypothetical protein